MNEQRAREILGDRIHEDRLLSGTWQLADQFVYVAWRAGDSHACLDGNVTADQLEAIAWWMRNKA